MPVAKSMRKLWSWTPAIKDSAGEFFLRQLYRFRSNCIFTDTLSLSKNQYRSLDKDRKPQ
ncbi:MAG: hypothetical protein OJF50_004586 [Nitrospira sp.]|nr:hypothetical protein [Nitrospira sp.]